MNLPRVSERARLAIEAELAKAEYKSPELDPDTATARAVRALRDREKREETAIFDLNNPADQILLTLS